MLKFLGRWEQVTRLDVFVTTSADATYAALELDLDLEECEDFNAPLDYLKGHGDGDSASDHDDNANAGHVEEVGCGNPNWLDEELALLLDDDALKAISDMQKDLEAAEAEEKEGGDEPDGQPDSGIGTDEEPDSWQGDGNDDDDEDKPGPVAPVRPPWGSHPLRLALELEEPEQQWLCHALGVTYGLKPLTD